MDWVWDWGWGLGHKVLGEAVVQESLLSLEIRRTFLVFMIADESLKALQLECSKIRRGFFVTLLKSEQKIRLQILVVSGSLMKIC